MSGRPRKYKSIGRYLLTLDAEIVAEFDEEIVKGKSRSAEVNRLMQEAIAQTKTI